jgi:nitrogen fixation-related uncharacterized protein
MESMVIIMLGIAMLAVLISLFTGLYGMVRGGDFNKKYGNALMQARVFLQGVALALFALAMVMQGAGG